MDVDRSIRVAVDTGDVTVAGNAVDFSYDEAMKNCYQCADAGKVRKLTEEVSGV